MQIRKILLLNLLLISCKSEDMKPSFFIEQTPIFLEEGAKEQLPCDLDFTIKTIRKQIESKHGQEISDFIMNKSVRLYPDYATIFTKLDNNKYLGDLKDGEEFHIRIIGNSILKTSLLHEQINHSLCEKVYWDINILHDNIECATEEYEIYVGTLDATEAQRDILCK